MPLEHYFTNNLNLKSEIKEIPYAINNIDFTFLSDNGVFAKNKIDYGSSFLVTNFLLFADKLDAKVLDVGCGYGFIGVVVSKILNIDVDFVDVNKRALHLCERNIKLNKVNGNVILSNCYEDVKNKYDYIITNPPIRAGKKIVYDILLNARSHLEPDGVMYLVIRKEQGAKSAISDLKKYYDVSIVNKSKGFYIIVAKMCWLVEEFVLII